MFLACGATLVYHSVYPETDVPNSSVLFLQFILRIGNCLPLYRQSFSAQLCASKAHLAINSLLRPISIKIQIK